jgi:hypothetical protein
VAELSGDKAVAQVLKMVKALAGEDDAKYANLNTVVQGCVSDLRKAAVAERPTHTQLKDLDHRIKNKKEQIERLAGLEKQAFEALELAKQAVEKSKDDSAVAKGQLEDFEQDRLELLAKEVPEPPAQGNNNKLNLQIMPEDLAGADDMVRGALQARLDQINTALGPMQKAIQEQMDLAQSLIKEARAAAAVPTAPEAAAATAAVAATEAAATVDSFEEMDMDGLDEELRKDIEECQTRARKQKGEEWSLVGGRRRKSG